jgi:Protein of unknown function, DUF547
LEAHVRTRGQHVRTKGHAGFWAAFWALSVLSLTLTGPSAHASSPAAQGQSAPFSDGTPVAGPSSASSPSATFVPQIAQDGDEAEPISRTQSQQIGFVVKNSAPTHADIIAPAVAYWGDVLGRYTQDVDDGLTRFDYAGLSASPEDTENLAKYIDYMAALKPSTLSPDAAMVYWANLYNALTVQIVAHNYPVNSIRKIKSGYRAGPWKRKLVTVESRELSLDNIEHDILRPTYQTPMVHYMVNCASIGCPNLKATPWQVATLAMDQEAAARAYINSPRGVKFNKGRLQVSSIYKWFKTDFGGNAAGVLAHLNTYADAELRATLQGRQKIDKYSYDWAVNAPK